MKSGNLNSTNAEKLEKLNSIFCIRVQLIITRLRLPFLELVINEGHAFALIRYHPSLCRNVNFR